MFVYLFDAYALKEIESGAQPGPDIRSEQSGPPVNHAAQIGALHSGFAKEKGEDGDDVRKAGVENLRAHAADAAEL